MRLVKSMFKKWLENTEIDAVTNNPGCCVISQYFREHGYDDPHVTYVDYCADQQTNEGRSLPYWALNIAKEFDGLVKTVPRTPDQIPKYDFDYDENDDRQIEIPADVYKPVLLPLLTK